MADLLSPFASVCVQRRGSATPPAAGSTPREPSRSSSPMRVIGFESSPTSVVMIRRWQSPADGSGPTPMHTAAAAEGADSGGINSPYHTIQPNSPGGKMPDASGPSPRPGSPGRHSSLGAALKQQDHITQLQRRLSINTGRSLQSGARGGGACALATLPPRPSGGVPAVAAARRPQSNANWDQDWIAALTPDSSERREGLSTRRLAAPQRPAAPAPDNPFAVAASAALDAREDAVEMQTSKSGPVSGSSGELTLQPAPLPPVRTHPRNGSATPPLTIARQGSASIDIPLHRMRRAGTAPALSDDLIAAAVAAAAAPAAAGGNIPAIGAAPTAGLVIKTQLASKARSCAVSTAASSAGTSPLNTSGTGGFREVFAAQAEAVTSAAQARVLQQALARERDRVCQLQRQLRMLLQDRAQEAPPTPAPSAGTAPLPRAAKRPPQRGGPPAPPQRRCAEAQQAQREQRAALDELAAALAGKRS